MAELLGIGVDMVEVERIAQLRRRHGDRIQGAIFTEAEMAYCLARANADESLAARFAAKEAVMKALGTGCAGGVGFSGIEVANREDGRPEIRLHGGAAAKARALGAGTIHVSLSHTRTAAIAQVIVEKTISP